MGYSTRYTLEVHDGEETIHDILEAVGESFEGLDYAVDINGESIEEAKWYSHEEDMLELSLKYPEVVFLLHGEGEENGDLWNMYFKNGKKQNCNAVVVYEEFDESKLI